MPVTKDKSGPYAPSSVIIDLIQRHRNKGLPSPVDSDVLARAGVSESLIPRTLQAMHTLDLLTDDDKPSDVLEGIRLASEGDYKKRLSEWLNVAYADALTFIDPAKDDETSIRDAFRRYTPIGQQDRMVTLFSGLFIEAGVMPEKQRQAPKRPTSSAPPKPKSSSKSTSSAAASTKGKINLPQTGIPPALAGLLSSLPADGDTWTQAERDRFVATFGAVIDFCFPPTTAPRNARATVRDADENDE